MQIGAGRFLIKSCPSNAEKYHPMNVALIGQNEIATY